MNPKMVSVLFRLAVVGTMLIVIWKFALPRKSMESVTQAKVDSLQYLADSLSNEVFILSTNVTRYEIALQRLAEEDSTAAAKFDKALSNIE